MQKPRPNILNFCFKKVFPSFILKSEHINVTSEHTDKYHPRLPRYDQLGFSSFITECSAPGSQWK